MLDTTDGAMCKLPQRTQKLSGQIALNDAALEKPDQGYRRGNFSLSITLS